ncbi:c-type cytochrome [Hyphomicrobium sp. ghe19]|uniref:c-type cytochrome n=1 Tax=Hyphomicrobium sp. ghe19 TaxID=2682968 RepID=UPI001367109D|nr:Cytochrome c-552 [Hyphomicrobium sp. ghe19]
MTRLTAGVFLIGILAIGCFAVFQPAPAVAQTLDELATGCAGCHGENGVPIDKTIPNIWGQNRSYLLNQLLDFKRGHRVNEQMSPMVEALSKADMEALATHFSKLAWPDLQQPPVPDDVKAKARAILNPLNCRGCHQEHYQGDMVRPRLAGQQDEYLVKTMTDFHTGDRKTYLGMVALMKSIDEADIKALGAYLAALQLPAHSDQPH